MINWFIEVVSECFLICIYSSRQRRVTGSASGINPLPPPRAPYSQPPTDLLVLLRLPCLFIITWTPTDRPVNSSNLVFGSLWCYQFVITAVFSVQFEFRSAQFVKMSKGTWPSAVGIVLVLLKVISCFFSHPHQIGIAIILSNNFFLADLFSVCKSVALLPYVPLTYQASYQAVYVIECCQRTKFTWEIYYQDSLRFYFEIWN